MGQPCEVRFSCCSPYEDLRLAEGSPLSLFPGPGDKIIEEDLSLFTVLSAAAVQHVLATRIDFGGFDLEKIERELLAKRAAQLKPVEEQLIDALLRAFGQRTITVVNFDEEVLPVGPWPAEELGLEGKDQWEIDPAGRFAFLRLFPGLVREYRWRGADPNDYRVFEYHLPGVGRKHKWIAIAEAQKPRCATYVFDSSHSEFRDTIARTRYELVRNPGPRAFPALVKRMYHTELWAYNIRSMLERP